MIQEFYFKQFILAFHLFSLSVNVKVHNLNVKQFFLTHSKDSITCITPGQSGPGSNGNERVLCIPQSSSITLASPSDCLVSYQGYLSRESYSSAEMKSVHSLAPAD